MFVSSANLSLNSQHHLYEAGIETDNPNVRSQAIAFIQAAVNQSEQITEDFLHRIDKIPVVKRSSPELADRDSTGRPQVSQPKTWLVGIHGMSEPTDPEEVRLVNAGTESAAQMLHDPESKSVWMRYGREERISKVATAGDNLIVIWRTCDSSSPELVYRHAPVLLNQVGPRCNRIFYEELPQAEESALTWIEFEVLCRRIGLRKVSKDSARELTVAQSNQIHELWASARGQSTRKASSS